MSVLDDLPIRDRWQDWYNDRAFTCFRDNTPLHDIHCEATLFGWLTSAAVIIPIFLGLWWCFYHVVPALKTEEGRKMQRVVAMLPAFATTFAITMLLAISTR